MFLLANFFNSNRILTIFFQYPMTISREFQINPLITLKLEGDMTQIYMGGTKFRQCKYLFLINPNETTGDYITSIDEAAERFDSKPEARKYLHRIYKFRPERNLWLTAPIYNLGPSTDMILDFFIAI